MRLKIIFLILTACVFLFPLSVSADISPPDWPPGANLAPESENTEVRMVSEVVIIDVQDDIPENSLGEALVTAKFIMFNLGEDAEVMFARFPLTFWNGYSDSSSDYPEIKDLEFIVGGQSVDWSRVMVPNPRDEDNPIPWAAFGVTFPPGQEVLVEVTYTAKPVGEYPFIAYSYVLETGAGWKGSIETADIIVRLPYEANNQNVILDETIGWSLTSPGAVLDGKEVSWHFENFEPRSANNIEVSLVLPKAWNQILIDREKVMENPQNGEAWGRLGKIYKEISYLRRWMRKDEGGYELYQLSVEAYEKSLELLPDDALWHAGFADLLWKHAYWDIFKPGSPNLDEILRAVEEIKIAYELKPEDPNILDILDDIRYSMPGAVEKVDENYEFLFLTATPTIVPTYTSTPSFDPTPIPQTPTMEPTSTSTNVPQPSPTQVSKATNTSVPKPTEASPQTSLPLCGSALLLVPMAVIMIKKKIIGG